MQSSIFGIVFFIVPEKFLRGKMSKRLTEKQKIIIIKALAEGASQEEAAKRAKCSQQTVSEIKSLGVESGFIKKEVREAIKNEIIDEQKEVIKEFDRIIRQGLSAITPEAMAKQSASANAMVIGTIFDKKQLATGGATENVNLTGGEKSKLVEIITKNESAKKDKNETIIKIGENEIDKTDSKVKKKWRML
jgi:hypothetical protein